MWTGALRLELGGACGRPGLGDGGAGASGSGSAAPPGHTIVPLALCPWLLTHAVSLHLKARQFDSLQHAAAAVHAIVEAHALGLWFKRTLDALSLPAPGRGSTVFMGEEKGPAADCLAEWARDHGPTRRPPPPGPVHCSSLRTDAVWSGALEQQEKQQQAAWRDGRVMGATSADTSRGGSGGSGGGYVGLEDVLVVMGSHTGRLAMVQASRSWRRQRGFAMRAFVSLNASEPAWRPTSGQEASAPPTPHHHWHMRAHNETYMWAPDEDPDSAAGMGRAAFVLRVARAPLDAHRLMAGTYSYMLYVDDDTLIFPRALLRLLQRPGMDPRWPLAVSDDLWYPSAVTLSGEAGGARGAGAGVEPGDAGHSAGTEGAGTGEDARGQKVVRGNDAQHPNPRAPRCTLCSVRLPQARKGGAGEGDSANDDTRSTHGSSSGGGGGGGSAGRDGGDARSGSSQADFQSLPWRPPEACLSPCSPALACAGHPDAQLSLAGGCKCPTAHGGSGMLFSAALMEALDYEDFGRCLERMSRATGGDHLLSHCLWVHGYAFTDPLNSSSSCRLHARSGVSPPPATAAAAAAAAQPAGPGPGTSSGVENCVENQVPDLDPDAPGSATHGKRLASNPTPTSAARVPGHQPAHHSQQLFGPRCRDILLSAPELFSTPPSRCLDCGPAHAHTDWFLSHVVSCHVSARGFKDARSAATQLTAYSSLHQLALRSMLRLGGWGGANASTMTG